MSQNILSSSNNGVQTWSGMGIYIAILEGADVAEVEILSYGYRAPAGLREMANALTEAAATLDPSSDLDRQLLDSIRYLEEAKLKIAMTIDDVPVQIVTPNITQSLIALAKALREKDGQS